MNVMQTIASADARELAVIREALLMAGEEYLPQLEADEEAYSEFLERLKSAIKSVDNRLEMLDDKSTEEIDDGEVLRLALDIFHRL